jgi:curli biogenesis system outer membrane secretion channel CsgG
MKHISLLLLCVCTCMIAFSQKTKVEKVKVICENLAHAQKPIAAVAPFKYAAANSASVGTGLSDMLMNALFNSGCFRVVERDQMNTILNEQALGLSGAGDEKDFAKVGKQIGAQLIIMGTITEFSDNESGMGGGVGRLLPGRTRLLVGGAGMRTAHIGYTIKLVNPSTGEVVSMQSFDKKVNKVGMIGGGGGGGTFGGGGFYSSKAMEDAVEQSLIAAVEFISAKKSDFAASLTETAGNNAKESTIAKADKENCTLLKLPRKLKIMVMIPEEHLAGAGSNYDPARQNQLRIQVETDKSDKSGSTSNNNAQTQSNNAGSDALRTVSSMFRPPDPAGETEIIKRFLEFGFEMVDAKQYEKLRSEKSFADAFDDPKLAAQIAAKYGADIVIVGEAFSEYARGLNNMVSCRARVEAKAIITNTARVLATEGFHGSGLDISEVIAGKTALKKAGAQIADYFLAQLCVAGEDVAATLGKGAGAASRESQIKFTNVDFSKSSSITKMLESINGVTKVERLSFADNAAVYSITHSGATDNLIEKVALAKSMLKFNIKNVTENGAIIDVK